MRVIARPVLREFADTHAETREDLDSWYHLMKRAPYQTPHELKRDFPDAKILLLGIFPRGRAGDPVSHADRRTACAGSARSNPAGRSGCVQTVRTPWS